MFSSQNNSPSLNPSREGNEEEVNEQLAAEDNGDGVNKLKHELESLYKAPMFQKPLTPSDVGKLNRLVIPKQHAVNYLPALVGGNDRKAADTSLSFEDELGKCWRFRYSYWNSSQNYVLTKGWSCFVRENRLDAGDVVLFERHRLDTDRFFIGLRRRATATSGVAPLAAVAANSCTSGSSPPQVSYSAPLDADHLPAGTNAQNEIALVGGSKRSRLFRVNVKCQPDDQFELPTTDCGSLSRANYRAPCNICL